MSGRLPSLIISAVDSATELFGWKPSTPIPVMKPGKVKFFGGEEIDGMVPTGEMQENSLLFFHAAKLQAEYREAFALWEPSTSVTATPVTVGWIVGKTAIDAAMKWLGEVDEIIASVIDHETREGRHLSQAEWYLAIREAAKEWHGFDPSPIELRKIDMVIRAMIPNTMTDDDRLRQACEDWNNKKTWREITLSIDGQFFDEESPQKQIDACTGVVKRFAKRNGIKLREGETGRKSRKNGGL